MWLDLGTGIVDTDPFALALGKTLVLASNFESNCKFVAVNQELALGLKRGEITGLGDPEWHGLINRLRRNSLGRNIKTLISASEEQIEILDQGRKARNYVVHDAGQGIVVPVEHLRDHQIRTRALVNSARKIAEADNIVSGWSYEISEKDAAANTSIRKIYVERCVKWVSYGIDS